MAIEWTTARVSEIASVTDYVANGSFESLRKNVTYRTEPNYAVLVRLVDHNARWNRGFVYVDKASFNFLRKSSLEIGDVVIANVGANAGTVFRVPNLGMPMTLGPNAVLCRPKDEAVLRKDFLYYLLIAGEGQRLLQSILSGSAQPKFNKTDFRSLTLPVPPLQEQRAIAHILGTLDDKIELNRRMSETLEAIARALFKSWFVDFDPVRAKAEGRDPGLPKPIADLFPSRFVDSELGEIPDGWGIKTIGDLAEIVGGSTPSTSEAAYWDGGVHYWATPKDLSQLTVPVLLDTERRISDTGLAQIGSGLLPVGTVLLSSRAPIGYLAIAEVPAAINQGFIAMKPRHGMSNLFLLLWARAAKEEILSRANGSTFLEISKANFRPISVVAPPAPIFRAFDRLARPLYEEIVLNARASRTLAALRDTLLPKLISGGLRVKDPERFIAQAGNLTPGQSAA